MSVTDAAVQADPASTPAAQGGDPGGAPYQEYLARIPQDQRGVVEPVFKDWDSALTRKFQEHAQFRDQWQRFEQHGLGEYEPAQLAQLASIFENITTPEDYVAWLQEQAEAAGLLPDEPPAPAPATGPLDPSISGAVEQLLAPLQDAVERLTGWQQEQEHWRQEQELATYQAEAQAEIETALAELQEQHGEIPVETLERFADRYVGTCEPREVVQKAFADYQAFVAQVEQGVFGRKLSQPATPQIAGTAAAPTEAPRTLAEAHEVAMARLRADRQA